MWHLFLALFPSLLGDLEAETVCFHGHKNKTKSNKQINQKNLIDASVVVTIGKERWGRIKRVKGVIYVVTEGDQIWGVSTQWDIQMMCYTVVHLKVV